jgi:hypothetical protein
MRRLLSLAVLLFVVPAASAGAANPVGFQTDLAGDQHVECSLNGSKLACLNYSAEAAGTCDFGGAVATRTLAKTGAPKASTTCVDEGFHGWPVLKPGKTWKRGAFKCRVRADATALTCTNRTGKHVVWVSPAAE